MNILITANSPGEVASWLRPVVGAFRELAPDARIHVCLTPCTFATGAEEAVVRSIPGVAAVYKPKETVAWALWGRRPPDFDAPRDSRGVVLFLGGDPFYAVLLGWRTGWPRAAYTEGRAPWKDRFRHFFVPGEAARERALASGAALEQVTAVGDLMLDGLTLRWPREQGRERLGLGPSGAPVVGLFPGSRRHEVRHALPFFLRVAARLAAARQGSRFAVALSPFVTPRVLTEGLGEGGIFSPAPDKLEAALFPREGPGGASAAGYPWSPEHRSAWVEWVAEPEGPDGEGMPTTVKVLLVRGAPFDVAAASDVVLTIPGSNTAELAGLGTPMVVPLSLDYLEEVPLEGLPGLLGNVPWLGPALRRKALARLDRQMPYLAWPNRKAGRMIVPEIRKAGLTPREVAAMVTDLLDDEARRERMAAELRRVMGPPGAAKRIAAACLALV